tara:strand:+ start:207 stop:839 length:633 start_codon:yes stop_codon:yes gene_type:complete
MSQFSILDIENYNKKLQSSYEDCVMGFKNTIYKYFLHYSLITQEKTITFDIKTLIMGIETIECIFLILLLKTKNLQLVIQNSENTIFYFFEFIEQMNRPNTELHALLNLTITDAKLFVYKKTLFDIQLNKTTNTTLENNIFCKLKQFTLVHKQILTMLLKTKNIKEIIEKYEYFDEYMKSDYTNEQINNCLAIDISDVNNDNLNEILDSL